MLVRLLLKNILSYYHETEFNMLVNPKRKTLNHHIYTNHPIPLLKQAVLYGANASGKSNLIEAIHLLKKIVSDKDALKSFNFTKIRFALISHNPDPCEMGVEFIYQETLFYYAISFNASGIDYETLTKGQTKQIIFERTCKDGLTRVIFYDDAGKTLDSNLQKMVDKGLKSNPHASLVALNHNWGNVLPNQGMEHICGWFENVFILKKDIRVSALTSKLEKNETLLHFVSNLLSKLDVGITNIEIQKQSFAELQKSNSFTEPLKDQLLEVLTDDNIVGLRNFEVSKEGDDIVFKSILLSQLGIDGYVGKLTEGQQSDGTQQLMHLSPLLYNLLNKEHIYFVDELESSIHPSLVKAFVKLFADAPSKGQLIFTTHESHLLDQQILMRPDEVWFAEKRDGVSCLHTLSDFKEHNTIDVEKGYLAGRYGGIPYLGSINELLNQKEYVEQT